jgi:hypothetical protein
MEEILKGKPRSIVPLRIDVTYESIMYAIATNQLNHKTLRAVVTMCRANPSTVVVVVYKSFEDSILAIFGEKPVCVRCEGSKLESMMHRHSKEDYIYVFTYVK